MRSRIGDDVFQLLARAWSSRNAPTLIPERLLGKESFVCNTERFVFVDSDAGLLWTDETDGDEPSQDLNFVSPRKYPLNFVRATRGMQNRLPVKTQADRRGARETFGVYILHSRTLREPAISAPSPCAGFCGQK